VKRIYDRSFKRYDEWYEENKFAYLSELEAIKKVLPQKGIGLEIGVGTGRFAAPLGIKYGIDPSEKMLSIASLRGVEIKKSKGENIPFQNSSFDYVAIIFTLCFVTNPKKVLEEAFRVLKKSGKIIIGIIDKNSYLGRHYQNNRGSFYKKAKFFTVEDTAMLIKKAGFHKFSFYQTLFDLPEKITCIENPLKGYGLGGFVVISAVKKYKSEI